MDVREKLVDLMAEFYGVDPMYHGVEANALANHLITNGVTVQKWISVDDRLPENIANRVLVVCERSNGVFYAHYEKPFWINLETDKPFISTVTHWMLLPELPKGANDAESVD